MSSLLVTSRQETGPLEVTVYPGDGDPIEFTLSSSKTSHPLDLPPGRYAIVGRRPNGARLHTTAVVPAQGRVDLDDAVPSSSLPFMAQEAARGLVPTEATAPPGLPGQAEPPLRREERGVQLRAVKRLENFADGSDPETSDDQVDKGAALTGWRLLTREDDHRQLAVHVWELSPEGEWRASTGDASVVIAKLDVSRDFLSLSIRPPRRTTSVGLLDETGFGPVVVVPPFREPVRLTFLAAAVTSPAADRDRNPGGRRERVALVTLDNPAAADLLGALAAPRTPPAEALWSQAAPGLDLDDPLVRHDAPLNLLREKFERPAEALLAAHYLLRFLPERLPLAWADNLVRALPSAADGPVLAAWARMLCPGGDQDRDVDRKIQELLREALRRPGVLFARTRTLLIQGLRFAPEIAAAGHQAHEAFRRAGAEAGGLEAYWGGHPTSAGKPHPLRLGEPWARVRLDDDGFRLDPATKNVQLPEAQLE